MYIVYPFPSLNTFAIHLMHDSIYKTKMKTGDCRGTTSVIKKATKFNQGLIRRMAGGVCKEVKLLEVKQLIYMSALIMIISPLFLSHSIIVQIPIGRLMILLPQSTDSFLCEPF